MSEIAGYLLRVIGLPAALGAAFVVVPLAFGVRATLGRFALAGVAFATFAALAIEIGSPALVRSLPAGLGAAWGDPSLAPERWHQVAFVALATLAGATLSLVVPRAVEGANRWAARSAVAAIAIGAAAAVGFRVEFPGEDAGRRWLEFAATLATVGGLRVLSRSDVRRPPGPAGLGGGIFLWASAALFGVLAASFLLVPFPSLAVASAAGGTCSLLGAVAVAIAGRGGRPVIDRAGLASVGFGTVLATLAFAGLAYGREKVPGGLWLAISLAPWAGVAVTPIARACVRPSASLAWRLVATAALPLAFAAPPLAREFLPSSEAAPPATADPMHDIYGDLGGDAAAN